MQSGTHARDPSGKIPQAYETSTKLLGPQSASVWQGCEQNAQLGVLITHEPEAQSLLALQYPPSGFGGVGCWCCCWLSHASNAISAIHDPQKIPRPQARMPTSVARPGWRCQTTRFAHVANQGWPRGRNTHAVADTTRSNEIAAS